MQDHTLRQRGNRVAFSLLFHALILFATAFSSDILPPVLGAAVCFAGQILSAIVGVRLLQPLPEQPCRRSAGFAGFACWLLVLIGAVALGQGISLLLSQIPVFSDLLSAATPPASALEWCVVLVGGVLLPAVCEEAFFRYAMLSALRPAGNLAAVCISATAFAVLHSPASFLSAFFAGLILGCFALRFPLWQNILLHLLANLTAVLLSFLSERALLFAILILFATGGTAWLCLHRKIRFFHPVGQDPIGNTAEETSDEAPARSQTEVCTPALCLVCTVLLLARIFAYR